MPVAKNLRAANEPSSGQSRNHAIRKSYSVGVVEPNKALPDQRTITGLFIAHDAHFPPKLKM